MKMNRLHALIATHNCPASSENESVSSYRKARDMVTNELNCPLWVSACIVTLLANKEIWFPIAEKETRRPKNAMEIVQNSLKSLNLNYSLIDYGSGGTSLVTK